MLRHIALTCLLAIAFFISACSQTPRPLPTEEQSSNTSEAPPQNSFLEHYGLDRSLEGIRSYLGGLKEKITEEDEKTAAAYAPRDHRIKVALLLPLSGPSAAIGESLQQAAELALFQTGSNNITLVPLDTKNTPEAAVEAANLALAENVDIIIGPLFANATEAIIPVAQERNISVLSFSNNTSLLGKGVFLLGFSPQQQVKRVTEYAYEQGFRSFSVLAPDDDYGHAAADEMAKVVGAKGLPVRDAQYYQAADEKLSESIKGIVDLSKKSDEGIKTEALLVPEGGQTLFAIAKRLTHKGVESGHIQLLGSGQWDDPETLKNPRLIGSWFATSDSAPRKQFEESYKKIYGEAPHRLASLAYDAIALCAVLSREKEPDFSRAAIKNSRGFTGVNGAFRFYRSELAERLLAVVEVTEDGFQIVDPASTSFSLF